MRCEIAGVLLDFNCRPEWIHERFLAFPAKNPNRTPDIRIQVVEEEASVMKPEDRIDYSGTGTPLYREDGCWCFTWQEKQTIPYLARSSADWRRTRLSVTKESLIYLREKFPQDWRLRIQVQLMQAVMQAFRYAILSLDGLYLHGVLTEYQGKAIGFSAASGTGKTTHVGLWQEAGYPITVVNGDNFVLKTEVSQVYAYGLPWCGSSNQFINKKLPYWGTVFLEQAPENSVCGLEMEQAYLQYIQRVFLPRFDPVRMETGLAKIEQLLLKTGNYILRCRPDQEAAKRMKEHLNKEFTSRTLGDKMIL